VHKHLSQVLTLLDEGLSRDSQVLVHGFHLILCIRGMWNSSVGPRLSRSLAISLPLACTLDT